LQFEFQYVARDRGWCLMEFINDIMNYGFLQKALITSVVVGIICGIIGSFIILRGLALMGDAISHAVLPGVAISYMLGNNYYYEVLQKALITSVFVRIICGIIGSFIILRGFALMGDAISHAVLPGVAISYMLGINYFYGAVVIGILTALGIGVINQNSRVKSDSSIGIVFSAMFALGIILITAAQSATDLTQILFGNVLSVRDSDMWMTIVVGIIVILAVVIFYKELLVSSFDETMAQAYGLKTRLIHYGIMFLLTLVTVASLQTVGV